MHILQHGILIVQRGITTATALLLLVATTIAMQANARTSKVLLVNEDCFHDLSLCETRDQKRTPRAPVPPNAVRNAPRRPPTARPLPSLTHLDERALDMTREQLLEASKEPERTGNDESFTRCIEKSIRSGNGLAQSSRVCGALHPEDPLVREE